MDMYSLDLFLHLAESLHFGRTSAACNISPSALSRQIQRLEDEVGELLFERDNRSVSLTPAGRLFREYSSDVRSRWEGFKDELNAGRRELKGTLSLFCSVTACYSILPSILRVFQTRYPFVQINLKTGVAADALREINEGEMDVAVAARPDRLPENLMFRELAVTPLVFIAPAQGLLSGLDLSADPLPWKDIPLILPERGLARKRVEGWFRDKGIFPHIYAEVAGNEAILAMVTLGCGVGVVPKLVIEKSPWQKQVRILDADPCLDPYSVGICIQCRRMGSPMVKAFWESASDEIDIST